MTMKRVGFAVALIGIFFFVMSFMDGVAAMRPHVDLYGEGVNISEVSAWDMIDTDIVDVWGSYATKTETSNGVTRDVLSYYIITAFEGDDARFIGIGVPEKEYDAFDKVMENTYDYYGGYSFDMPEEYIHKTGRLKKMNSEMAKYYYEWFEETGWYETEAEMKEAALPYYIDPIADPSSVIKMMAGGGIVGIIGIVILVFAFIKDGKKTQKAVEQTHVVINGVTYPKQTLAHVNASILGQEKIFAAQELAEITGVSLEEAGDIVEHWGRYYY